MIRGQSITNRWAFLSITLATYTSVSLPAPAQSNLHYERVVFENSSADDMYFHSQGNVVVPSELEMQQGRCPVECEHFVSPSNSLRLRWKSGFGGAWSMMVKIPPRIGPEVPQTADTLSMWVYSEEELQAKDSPRVQIYDLRGNGPPDLPLLATGEWLPAKQWVRLNFPFANFVSRIGSTGDSSYDSLRFSRVNFAQGMSDNVEHTIYVDDIRVVDSQSIDDIPPAAPTGLAVTGYDSHCDLSWQPNSEADLLSYRIYRSDDGQNFSPVATRPGNCSQGVDYIGSNRTVWYKVSAVDFDNNESPLSEVATASTNPADDEALLEMVQRGCFRYYWDAAHPNAGMALEVLPGDPDLVALGGSGFGISTLVVATERGFITREQGVNRLLQIVRFLSQADRFHGVWPHFLDGRTGRTWPLFGKYDNGGDLVETAFLMQGLLTARQYFNQDSPQEREIRDTITKLWHEVEWDWYRKTPDSEVLYWHWSPDHEWHISHPLVGWNETMIVYLLAIASPTHAVPASLYHTGWAGQSDLAVGYRQGWSRTNDGDHYVNGNTYFGQKLDVGSGTGGDLFFTQFSFLGFDPRGICDRYTNYFHNNRQLALINRGYCIDNPRGRLGYGPDCWGRSAGVHSGGGKPLPRDDNGTICVSAALGVFPYTPEESLTALKHFYRKLGSKIWGVYGFHDGFNQTQGFYDEYYMGLNQAQIVVGIENHRSGLAWKHFMSNPEIKPMLDAIGFVADKDSDAVAVTPVALGLPREERTDAETAAEVTSQD